jgi:phosphopantothenoylcysteine decarboxylase/phosphopantothenate--cysteine ligase
MMKKKIIIGVTGSIAAYKSCDLARLFVKGGFDPWVVLTENAARLVTPLTFSNLTGNPAMTGMWSYEQDQMGHIALKDNAVLMVVAPASANIIGKFAGGIADDLLSTTFLSVSCPVLVAPAMNPAMWSHPAVKKNMKQLSDWGIHSIGPDEGDVVCGDMGRGRMSSPEEIYERALSII